MSSQPAKQQHAQQEGALGHEIVVVGASVGGVEALKVLVGGLPERLAAAVLVVQHVAPGPSVLPEILSRSGPLRVTHAVHGERIERGRIYVAPPDNHLLVRPGALSVVRGPRENGHRPSVDALFRSAAQSYGPRVVGVVLTGSLDCGTAGALSIRARNGLVVVQDPAEARAPSMPASVMEHLAPDHVARLAELGPLLARLVAEPPAATTSDLPRELMELEGSELGMPAPAVCPLCQGVTTETRSGEFRYYRCHVGHTFSGAHMTREQEAHVERSLWSALRAMEESAELHERLAETAAGTRRARYRDLANERREQVELLRALLLSAREGGASESAPADAEAD